MKMTLPQSFSRYDGVKYVHAGYSLHTGSYRLGSPMMKIISVALTRKLWRYDRNMSEGTRQVVWVICGMNIIWIASNDDDDHHHPNVLTKRSFSLTMALAETTPQLNLLEKEVRKQNATCDTSYSRRFPVSKVPTGKSSPFALSMGHARVRLPSSVVSPKSSTSSSSALSRSVARATTTVCGALREDI